MSENSKKMKELGSISTHTVSIFVLIFAMTTNPANCFTSSLRELSPTLFQNRCTQNQDCWFGGTCDTNTGVCNCHPDFSGKFCEATPSSICSSDQYLVLQRQSILQKKPICNSCDSSCEECFGPSKKDCLSCPLSCASPPCKGTLFYQYQCFDSCPPGSYKNSTICQACHSDCQTCFGSAQHCITCNKETHLKIFKPDTNECHSKCPTGSYDNGRGNCNLCDSKCTSCNGPAATDCLSCASPFLKHGYECVSECPTGTTSTAQNCANNCPLGQYTKTAGNANCTACHPACLSCKGGTDTDCIVCSDGKVFDLDSKQCLKSCPLGKYLDSSLGACLDCPYGCATCDGTGSVCTSCYGSGNSQKLLYGTCLTSCPLGFYETSDHQCFICNFTCRSCRGPQLNECQTCYSQTQIHNWKFHLKQGSMCVEQCLQGTTQVGETCV